MGKKYRRYSTKEIANVLERTGGLISPAARLLNVDPSNLRKRVMRDPKLQAVLLECREALVDAAESVLMKGISAGDTRCALFVLKTLGKERGYSEKVQIQPYDDYLLDIHVVDSRAELE